MLPQLPSAQKIGTGQKRKCSNVLYVRFQCFTRTQPTEFAGPGKWGLLGLLCPAQLSSEIGNLIPDSAQTPGASCSSIRKTLPLSFSSAIFPLSRPNHPDTCSALPPTATDRGGVFPCQPGKFLGLRSQVGGYSWSLLVSALTTILHTRLFPPRTILLSLVS